MPQAYWAPLAMVVSAVVIVMVLGLGVSVLVLIARGKIPLDGLISEPGTDKASLSRFQFLLFTFVIGGLYLLLCIENGTFIEIPSTVLGLLGISGGSYIASKGIQTAGVQATANATAKVAQAAADATAAQAVAAVRAPRRPR